MLVILVPFSTLILGTLVTYREYSEFQDLTRQTQTRYLASQEALIREQVERIVQDIVYWRAVAERRNPGVDPSQMREDIYRRISQVAFGPDGEGFVFVGDYEGVELVNRKSPHLVGHNFWEMEDTNGVKVFQREIEIAKTKPEGGFLKYWWSETGDPADATPKMSFVKGVADWEIFVGAGVNLDEVETLLDEQGQQLRRHTKKHIFRFLLVLVLLFFAVSTFAIVITRRIKESLHFLDALFRKKSVDGAQVTPQAIHYAEFENLALSASRMVEERDQAEDELSKARAALDAAIEQTPAGIIIADAPNCRLRLINAAAVDITGQSRDAQERISLDEQDELNWTILGADGTPIPVEERALPKAIAVGEMTRDAELIVRRADGTERWILLNGSPIRDRRGEIIGGVVVFSDITERKQTEENRLSLEHRVLHAQKLESLGALAGGIAHDFNGILMAILGNADLALQYLSAHAPARDNVKEIEIAARRAAGLSKQMLAYSGKGEFVVEPILINEFVEEMAHLIEVSISKRAVLKFNFAKNLPPFDGDATQIRQVIMNLITNASEAIGETSGVIALSTGAMDCDRAYLDTANVAFQVGLNEPLDEGAYVYLEVADTGCGMDRGTIEKIFDPFFTTKLAGRGLGMAAVLGIVRGHKGAIKIYSEENKGTTLKVLFPASDISAEATTENGEKRTEPDDWRGSGTILVADDEESVCTVGEQMLGRLGFSVLTAPDGREAVKIFGEQIDAIDCVILDLTMPHLDGEQAFREMRRLRPEIKVILSSGYNEQDATQRFSGKGLAGFIQKPYTMASLKTIVQEVMEN